MSNKAMTWAFELDLKMVNKFVLVALSDYADEQNSCFPSHKSVAKRVGSSISTVRRAIESLETEGYLKTLKRFDNEGKQTSNRYVLNVGFMGVQREQGGCSERTGVVFTCEQGGCSPVNRGGVHNSEQRTPNEPPMNHKESHASNDALFTPKQEAKKETYSEDFNDLYKLYGNTRNKAAAFKAYKAKRKQYTHEQLMNFIRQFLGGRERDRRGGVFVPNLPYLSTVLNGSRWEDYAGYTLTGVQDEPKEFTESELNQILGLDNWKLPEPPHDFGTLEEEMSWRREMKKQRRREREEEARKKLGII